MFPILANDLRGTPTRAEVQARGPDNKPEHHIIDEYGCRVLDKQEQPSVD